MKPNRKLPGIGSEESGRGLMALCISNAFFQLLSLPYVSQLRLIKNATALLAFYSLLFHQMQYVAEHE
jgi:hypothetical protein